MLREGLILLAIAAAMYMSAGLSLSWAVIDGRVSPVWLASGVGFAATLKFGPRAMLPVLVGAFFATRSTGASAMLSAFAALGNALGAGAAALICRRAATFHPKLDRVRDVLVLVPAAALGPVVSASLGTLGVVGFGSAALESSPVGVWLTWWSGDAIGVIVVGPALLTLANWEERRPRRIAELLVMLVLFGLSQLTVFGGLTSESSRPFYTHSFLTFPFLAWGALRFGAYGASLLTQATAVIAVVATSKGAGPFVTLISLEGVMALQLYLSIVALTSLLLAATSTEREHASAQARYLAEAIRGAQDAIVVSRSASEDGIRVDYSNEAFRLLVGAESELAVWKVDERLVEADKRKALLGALRSGDSYRCLWAFPRPDRTSIQTELQVSPVIQPDGSRVSVLVFRDVTELKGMEAKLVLSERLAGIGLLAAGVGHEINNPLSFVMNHLHALEQELGGNVTSPERLKHFRSRLRDASFGAERIASIVASLKVLSRDAAEERTRLDVNALVRRMLDLASPRVKLRATLSVELNGNPRVVANEARLGQVFLNLLINAVQAVPEASPARNHIHVRTVVEDGEVRIELSDSGAGIPEEIFPRIFDPFFTTKPPGEGTGLGLFLARQIVTDYGGRLSASSRPGEGSTFVITFPLAAPTPEDTLAHPPASEVPSRTTPRARILIVDDEVRLTASMQMLLEEEHDVVTAASGREALELLVTRREHFDVVLCDLQMPEISGMDVHRRLGEIDPESADRIIFYSGGAYSPEAREFVRSVKNTILMKPIPPEQLFVTIAEGLRRASRRAG